MSGPQPIPAPILAEAEEIIRSWKLGGGSRMAVIMVEYDRRGAAIKRVRVLHVKSDDGPYCETCGPAYHTICCDEPAWPCQTIEVLDGAESQR